ncbi:hypothetical protein DIPPA_00444 [Diplonema papillatum]|nr:hypothetical protein DIPPA_00444 [Diplonema papillatum]
MAADAEAVAVEDACAKADDKARSLLREMEARMETAKAQTLALFAANQQAKVRIGVKRRKLAAVSDDVITLSQRKAALELEVRQLRTAVRSGTVQQQQHTKDSDRVSTDPTRTSLLILYEDLLGLKKAAALAAGVEHENQQDGVTTCFPSRTAFVVKRMLSDKKGAPSLMEAAWSAGT